MAGSNTPPTADTAEARRIILEHLRHPAVDKVALRYRDWEIRGADLRQVADYIQSGRIRFIRPVFSVRIAAYEPTRDIMMGHPRQIERKSMGVAVHEGTHAVQDMRAPTGGWQRWNLEAVAVIAEMMYVLSRWGTVAGEHWTFRADAVRLINARGLLRTSTPQAISEAEVRAVAANMSTRDWTDIVPTDGIGTCGGTCQLYGS